MKTYKQLIAEIKDIPKYTLDPHHLLPYIHHTSMGVGGPKAKKLLDKQGRKDLEAAQKRYDQDKKRRLNEQDDYFTPDKNHTKNADNLEKIISKKFTPRKKNFVGSESHTQWYGKNHSSGTPSIVYQTFEQGKKHRISIKTKKSEAAARGDENGNPWISFEGKTFREAKRKFLKNAKSELSESHWGVAGAVADLGASALSMLATNTPIVVGGPGWMAAGEKRDAKNEVKNLHNTLQDAKRNGTTPAHTKSINKSLKRLAKLSPDLHYKVTQRMSKATHPSLLTLLK